MVRNYLLLFVFIVYCTVINAQPLIEDVQVSFPTTTSGNTPTVAAFSKFEIKLAIQMNIGGTPPGFNKYDPKDIAIWVEYIDPFGNTQDAKGMPYRATVFPYQSFQRNNDPKTGPINNCLDGTDYNTSEPSYLTISSNGGYDWRARFSPPEILGTWSYIVYAQNRLSPTLIKSTTYYFDVTNRQDRGYLEVHPNNRNFRFKDPVGEIFMPMGYNVNPQANSKSITDYNRVPYMIANKAIDKLGENGGNFIRAIMSYQLFAIEGSEDGIGVYDTRQKQAFDLDQLFDDAYDKGVYIQLCLGASSELGNDWSINPYRTILSVPEDFYDVTNASCVDRYKQKLRYIVARWGYSTHLFAYEFLNEIDQSPGFWNSSHPGRWVTQMTMILKTMDARRHMVTNSASNVNDAEWCGYKSTFLDFTSEHHYTAQYNVDFQLNALYQRESRKYNMPATMGEFYFGGYPGSAWLNQGNFLNSVDHNDVIGHNMLWTLSHSGSGGPGALWLDVDHIVVPPDPTYGFCWGGSYKHFKPLRRMMSEDDILYHEYMPIGNECTGNAPSDEPNGITNGCYSNRFDGGNWDPRDRTSGILTNDNNHLEVFGLKTANKVAGWIHYKNNFWANLPNTCYGCPGPNYSVTPNTPAYPGNITLLSQRQVTIEDMCEGTYKVEFYCTYPGYDIEGATNAGDGDPDNGGILEQYTINDIQVGCGGNLTFTVPDMVALGSNTVNDLKFPDYGFRVTKTVHKWSHKVLPGDPVDGTIATESNHIFYRGADGRLNHLYPTSENEWQHTIPDTDPAEAVGSGFYNIAVSENAQHVFYRGQDSRVQHWYWENQQWHHVWHTDWNNNTQNIYGAIATSQDGGFFYHGAGDRLHRYYYVGGGAWAHQLVSSTSTDQNVKGAIAVSQNGQHVFYHGQDDRLHHYYYESGSWHHVWMTNWSSNSQNVAGDIVTNAAGDVVYYVGIGGKLHEYKYAGSGVWVHDIMQHHTTPTSPIYDDELSGGLSISPSGNNIFFRGNDGYLCQRYYQASTGASYDRYGFDRLVCDNDLVSGRKSTTVGSPLLLNFPVHSFSNDKVFYKGASNGRVHAYLYNVGCNYVTPQERETGMKNASDPVNPSTAYAGATAKREEHFGKIDIARTDLQYAAHPNPFKNELKVTLANDAAYTIQITNTIGMNIYSRKVEKSRAVAIPTEEFAPGLYIITIRDANGAVVKSVKANKL